MEFQNNKKLFMLISVLGLLSQTLILPIVASNSIDVQKTYYSSPPHGHSHGSGSPPAHGGVSCSPNPPAHHGGSGGQHSTPAVIPPPTPTITPVTPTAPSPPVPTDPGHGPFPCTYWGSHPGLIWGVLGWWGTMGGVFGVATLPGVTSSDPSSLTLQHVLTNPSKDGYSALYREAAASFLNSVAASKKFPFTTSQVRSSFISALASVNAAASQARIFSLANQGHLKLH